MRIVVTAVAATALLGAASVAFAADATGKIKSVDANKDMIMLDNGSSYVVPKSVKLSDFKVGERSRAIYNKTGDKFDVTSIKPADLTTDPLSSHCKTEAAGIAGGLRDPAMRSQTAPSTAAPRPTLLQRRHRFRVRQYDRLG